MMQQPAIAQAHPVAQDLVWPGRQVHFHFCENYRGKGPRVILLSGKPWPRSMREHYGVTRESFYSRSATNQEPSTYPNGHPWGWVYSPDDLIKDEAHMHGHLQAQRLQAALHQEMHRAGENPTADSPPIGAADADTRAGQGA